VAAILRHRRPITGGQGRQNQPWTARRPGDRLVRRHRACAVRPRAVELVTQAAGQDYAYTATRLPHYNGLAWTRHLLWLPGRYTFVLDEMTAEEPGEYSLVLGWRSLGRPSLAGGLFTAAQDDATGRNRFFLRFPAQVAAALDRDTDLLGAFVPDSPYHDKAINIVEQSLSRTLGRGVSACFQNVFWATAGKQLRAVELRRLNEHCVLLRSCDRIALADAGVAGATITLDGLRVAGRMFYLSPERALLHQATATLDGQPIAEAKLRNVLQQAWDKTSDETLAAADPWASLPRLPAAWKLKISSKPLCLTVPRSNNGFRLVVGTEAGVVQQWDQKGRPTGDFHAAGPVHALHAVDLNGYGTEELLAGSDDEHVYALDAHLVPLWRYRPPFQIDATTRGFCTMRSSKGRKILADDLDGDGRPEILLGVGNMRLHCLDATGRERWRFITAYGTVTTMVVADVYGDGQRYVVAGPTLTRPRGHCWVLDAAGKPLQTLVNGAWGVNLQAVAVADLKGNGQRTIFCGGNEGNVTAWPADRSQRETLHVGRNDQRWTRNLTRPIRSFTVLPEPGLLAVGSESGCLAAFDGEGSLAWNVSLGSAVTHTALVHRPGGPRLVVAGCKNGRLILVRPDGWPAARFDGQSSLQALIAIDLDGDGEEELVAAGAAPNQLLLISP